ncbi:hypothetical protein [Flagellimonas sp. S3867]|uniref:hypothetical protein n=1 Tax=Flagellimonas sp. S3867 TaxID=2768063 RepID=UPI001684839A|nr:hypothetical protein [Flagellimonas sp. S3867]
MMNKTGGKTMTGNEGYMGMQKDTGSDSSGEMMKMEFSDGFMKDFEAVLPAYLKLKDIKR